MKLRYDGWTVCKVFALNLGAGTADVHLENDLGQIQWHRISVHKVEWLRGQRNGASWEVVMDELERRAGIVF